MLQHSILNKIKIKDWFLSWNEEKKITIENLFYFSGHELRASRKVLFNLKSIFDESHNHSNLIGEMLNIRDNQNVWVSTNVNLHKSKYWVNFDLFLWLSQFCSYLIYDSWLAAEFE